MRVAIGFGSNQGNRYYYLTVAASALGTRGVRWQAFSSVYETIPVGPVADQPPFLNQVGIGETELSPRALLEVCLAVEREQGRERTVRWGPRTLDLDILLYGDRVVDETDLRIPHPEMTRRAFVMVPLAEACAPWEWQVPGTGPTVRELAQTVDGREGVRVWRSSVI